MRMIVACAALMALAVTGAKAKEGAAGSKDSITDTKIINSCGDGLSKMFSRFGTPEDLRVLRGDTSAEDDVFCDYGAYGFRVRNKAIRTCFFFSDWKGQIRGIKIGDGLANVVKVLGNATTTSKDKDGAVTAYGYELKDLGADFFANFDKDGKVWRVEVTLK